MRRIKWLALGSYPTGRWLIFWIRPCAVIPSNTNCAPDRLWPKWRRA